MRVSVYLDIRDQRAIVDCDPRWSKFNLTWAGGKVKVQWREGWKHHTHLTWIDDSNTASSQLSAKFSRHRTAASPPSNHNQFVAFVRFDGLRLTTSTVNWLTDVADSSSGSRLFYNSPCTTGNTHQQTLHRFTSSSKLWAEKVITSITCKRLTIIAVVSQNVKHPYCVHTETQREATVVSPVLIVIA